MVWRAWLVLVGAIVAPGCGGDVGADDAPDPVDEPGDPDPDPEPDPPSADEAAARAAIAGERDPGEVLLEVAQRGGWPVATRDGTFLVVVATDAPDAWSIAGDHDGWASAAMAAGPGLAWAELSVPSPAGSRYKVVRDDAWIADPSARSVTWDEFGMIGFVRPPEDAWRVDRWPAFAAEGLPARPVHALVPPGGGPWPTLYVQDGQNLFDPGAPWGGWRMREAAAGASRPALIVGIFAGPDRLAEYAHTDDVIGGQVVLARGDAYARLVEEQVRPAIEATYGAPTRVGLLGSSMGGLAALSIAQAAPERWDFAGSLSGTLGWGRFGTDGPTIEERFLADPPRGLVVYVDSGGGPGADGCTDPDGDGSVADDPDHRDNYCTNRSFADALAGAGWAWGETLHHWHEPGAAHNEAAWAARVGRPLGIFLDGGR